MMTQRERMLTTIVGSVLLLVVNLFLINFFLKNQRRLSTELTTKTAKLAGMQTLFAEQRLWEERSQWIAAKQPKLTNPTGAGVELLDQVKSIAQKHEVLVKEPVIDRPVDRKQYSAVAVNLDTTSTYASLVAFLREIQGPDQFVVLENAKLERDTTDKTQMHGRFKIARWFASAK